VRVLFTGGGTGGHLYPALAIARALVDRVPAVEPFFIGARRGIEREILPTTEFKHALLDLHPLYRTAPWRNVSTVRSMWQGWRRVASIARDVPPALVVATGGYASGATLAFAATKRIPYVLQEANADPGQTIRLFSRWAREIYLGFPEASVRLPASAQSRVFDTGNPIAPPPSQHERVGRELGRAKWKMDPAVNFVALVFGGSQGSAALNRLTDAWIAQGLPKGVGLIWGTGRAHYEQYAARESSRVMVRPYLAPIAEAYEASDIAITRAGAMTTAELCAWGIPMFLIPLPTAAADHQTINARSLSDAGAAAWIEERRATPGALTEFAEGLRGDSALYQQKVAAALDRARPDAATVIAGRIERLLSSGEVRGSAPLSTRA
jgi:UDP-N-acetylglucosamine--N-acetylmuramyl-(pentapeptide) pyrophosphoryl-undecaprenol N-acetylglucosamine transferase